MLIRSLKEMKAQIVELYANDQQDLSNVLDSAIKDAQEMYREIKEISGPDESVVTLPTNEEAEPSDE
ncbi:hypothetical protein L1987_07134 [Smallanthus sonchifolius]|uniref:Uncharacterized protein n=1 Tax=Smallanthus sonchifolius TaxID=185202 RepID=A0ACB9K061_9ASTR|nr:hypothetical protein L1987_07134 [Smallanthus sonchifolius]